MAALFHGYDTYVGYDIVEHKGQRYNPQEFLGITYSKEEGLVKAMIFGAAVAVFGIYSLTKGWTTFGWVCLIGGALWGGWNWFWYQDKRVTTFCAASFSGGRHTGNPDVFVAVVTGYDKALKLGEALYAAKEGREIENE